MIQTRLMTSRVIHRGCWTLAVMRRSASTPTPLIQLAPQSSQWPSLRKNGTTAIPIAIAQVGPEAAFPIHWEDPLRHSPPASR